MHFYCFSSLFIFCSTVGAGPQDEKRCTFTDSAGCHSVIKNTATRAEVRVLPPGLEDVKLLVLQLDQGSIGAAGAAYLENYLGWMVYTKFDKIHRCIRDLKLAAQAVPIFVKTKLWSSYLFSLNKRPFGSGAFGTAKERMMECFIAKSDVHSPIFRKYLQRLSMHWDMPMDTEAQQQAIFDRVCEMPSFGKHMAHPKLQNWFAWNQCCYDQLDEYYGAKCVFESELDPDQVDPGQECFSINPSVDPRAELQRILKNGGGIPLAYRLMKDGLYEHTKRLSVAEKATWDWYTAEVTQCKSPKDALAYSMRNVEWSTEEHLYETLANVCYNAAYLQEMQLPYGPSQMATDALALAWRIVGRRAWTLSKHSCPPESYARILQVDEPESQQRASEQMRKEHTSILKLEASRHTDEDAMALWKAIAFLNSRPIRCMLEFFKKDWYSPDSSAGKKLMCGMLATMESNKSVEDVHQPIRLDAKANQNRKLSKDHIQDLIINSGSFEARGVRHGAKVPKATFLQEFSTTPSNAPTSYKHDCIRHKLPKEVARMMRPGLRPWPAHTEDVHNIAAAAWSWLQAYFELKDRGVQVGFGAARLSKLLQPCTIVRRKTDKIVFASLANASWAGLGLPLDRFADCDGIQYSKFKKAPVQFLHVYKPADWEVLPFLVTRLTGHGVVMQDSGPPLPLMQSTLQASNHQMTAPDLERCCTAQGIEVSASIEGEATASIEDNLTALGKHFGGDGVHGEAEASIYIERFYFCSTADEDLLKDPLAEAVFDNLDEEDKAQFDNLEKARNKLKRKRAFGEDYAEAPPVRRRPSHRLRRPRRPRRPAAAGLPSAAQAVPLPDAAALALAPAPQAAALPDAATLMPAPQQMQEEAVVPAVMPAALALPLEPPPPPAPPVARHRAANVFPQSLEWQNVMCPACGKLSGQVKYLPGPARQGKHDSPTWAMRCWDYRSGRWPLKLPGYKQQVEGKMMPDPETCMQNWIHAHRSCCEG